MVELEYDEAYKQGQYWLYDEYETLLKELNGN